ncbi:LOW QUALITY PROTEIN: obscurin-like protein 1a [Electrophorus electricus]|uniref:LOW QUALITY PROTEIN: obscurin-like protein 1a n=1 Tax=Electrophorus electricus TaxID=8005 RepID=UPI0015D03AE5|nr:LOW QUALITY PROTEIN: obscurin-like protein 1a [Electrophorus electricus]
MDVFGGAPRVLAYPRPILVKIGSDVVLKCQISGDPQPDVVWERKNEPVIPGGRYILAQDGKVYTLSIVGVILEDAGQYICRAKNCIGETYAAATLKVEEESPEVQPTRPPHTDEQEVQVIPPEQNLQDVKQARQPQPEREDSLSHGNKPHFLIKPLSLRVDRGEDAAFSCKLWGKPLPQVVWEKDGKHLKEIYESSHFRVDQQDGGWFQLKIFRTRAPDAGVYTCRAANEHGDTVAGAVLLVEAVPESRADAHRYGYTNGHWSPQQSRDKHPRAKHSKDAYLNVAKAKKFTITEGKHAKFRCYVTGKPKPEIVWKKDGEPVEPGRRHLLFEDREGYYTLKVLYCKQQDTGLYICAASNALGNTLSAVNLIVKGPMVRFKRGLQDVEVRERDVAVLECEVPEESMPIAWYLEDLRLHPSSKYGMDQKGTRRRLTIRDVGIDDDGVYLCEMPDGGKSIAELAVKGTIVKKLPRRLEVLEGENAAFCVEVEEEEMEVFWFKDGLQLRETHQTIIKSFGKTHILVFVNSSYQDSGTITFIAGRSKTSSKLRVKAIKHCPPICPVGVQIRTDSPNSAILSWSPSPNLQSSSKSVYVLERQEAGSQDWQRCLTIETGTSAEILGDGVPCEGDYRFRVCCMNKYGRSGHVEFPGAVHLVPGPKIKTPMKNTVVTEGEDAVFSIELSTSMVGTWFLNSTQLQQGEHFDLSQSQNLHALRIRSIPRVYNGAEITFIATGVRDSATLHVQAAAVKFVPLPEADSNKRVEAGSPIVLYCEVSHPVSAVRWFKDGRELLQEDGLNIQSDGNMRRIVIQSSEYSHSGVYTCQSNDDVITFNVDVKAPRAMFESLTESEWTRSVDIGHPIVLHCEVSDPQADVCWFKDGEPIYPHSGTDIQAKGNVRTLVIDEAGFLHSGSYTCQSADDVAVFQVDVTGPPVSFKDIPEDERHKITTELDPVVLHCELSQPDVDTRWLKDGLEVLPGDNITIQAEGTMHRLILRSAELADAGTYTCQAGDHTMSYTVYIKEPPVTIVDPKDDVRLDHYVSEKIVLSCELSRTNGEATWFKDGLKVQESQNVRLSTEGPYRRLSIPCASVWDTGEYMCDTGGDSVIFQLCVTEAPVRFVLPSQPEVKVSLLSSETLVLSCQISEAEAQVCWYCDGVEVEESDRLLLEEDGPHRRLIIPSTTIDDSAEYVCETRDDAVTFWVKIEEPPVKLSCSKKTGSVIQSFAGDPLFLELQVSRENAEVCWMKDGVKVEEDSDVTVTVEGLVRKLTLWSPTPADSGLYTCNAMDDAVDFHVRISEAPLMILNKHEIKTELKALLSDDIVLECELSRPNGAVRWYKDGDHIEENDRFCFEEEGAFRSLVILCAEPEDSGKYFLDAKDDSISFQVTVQEPPVKILGNSGQSDYQEMLAGDDLILACEVSRENAPVQWLFNETALLSDSRMHIESYGTLRKLIVSNVQPSDSGTYTCDAVDDKMVSSVKVQASLLPPEPPVEFLNKEEPVQLTGYEAESITLTATVSRPNAPVRWLKDWTPVDGERFHATAQGLTRTLTISPLKRLDSGEYTCDANTDELHFSLLVKEMRIKFLKPLFDSVAHKDGMVTLRCEVNKPKADVQWLKDGTEVMPSRRFSIRADGMERSLTIHRLSKEDAGEYTCETRDDCTSARIRVEMPRVVEFLTELHNTTVMEGEDAAFKCVVSPDDVQMLWFMDDEMIQSSGRFTIEQNGLCHTLLIHNVQMLDASRITAEAEGLTSKASLRVQEAQVLFTKKMEVVMAEEFGEATLETEVSLESGEVQWMRQGVVIQPGPRHSLSQSGRSRILRITGLSMSDRGTYRCETLHDRTQVKLNVEPRKITIWKGLTDIETFERETASLEVELSHADVKGVWQKDGLRVKPSNSFRVSANGRVHSLTLTNLTLEDSSTITFSAEGVRTSAQLLVKETPVAILKKLCDVRLEEGSPITLECELSRPNVNVRWLKNGSEVKADKGSRVFSIGRRRCLQIAQSTMGDSGLYTCDIGDLQTFCKVEIYERELEVVTELEDLYIKEDQNAVFMCEVSLEDVPGDWYKDGHRIRPSDTVKIRTEGTKHFLLICNVRTEDAGEIKFVSKQVESAAYLSVQELPVSIVRGLRDRTALEKHRLILECTTSSPRCAVRWYKGDEELEPSERMDFISEDCCHKLVIHQVAIEDEGAYSIEVGEHLSTAKLMVEAQSIILVKELEDVEVSSPDPARFRCEVSVPLIKPPVWTLNGETLQPGAEVRLESKGTVYNLTFTKTSSDMSGTVQFTTGKARSSAMLRVM